MPRIPAATRKAYRFGRFAAGICAYALGLVMFAPATLLDAGVSHASQGRLRIAEAQGTLWSGVGRFELRDATRRRGVGRGISWHFRPLSVLRGCLGFDVGTGQAAKRFAFDVSISHVRIRDADLVFPAAAMGIAMPRLAVLEPTGDLFVHIADLSIAQGAVAGSGSVQWHAAGSSLTTVSPLGDYDLRFDGTAGAMHASLRTVRGLLRLDGAGFRGASGAPEFVGTARVGAEHAQQLAPLLRLIAIERGKGDFKLQLNRVLGRAPGI